MPSAKITRYRLRIEQTRIEEHMLDYAQEERSVCKMFELLRISPERLCDPLSESAGESGIDVLPYLNGRKIGNIAYRQAQDSLSKPLEVDGDDHAAIA